MPPNITSQWPRYIGWRTETYGPRSTRRCFSCNGADELVLTPYIAPNAQRAHNVRHSPTRKIPNPMKLRNVVTGSGRRKGRGIHSSEPSQIIMAIAANPSMTCAQAGRTNQRLENALADFCVRTLGSHTP